MKCTSCGHEQESGKFCGKCGNSMIPASSNNELGATVEEGQFHTNLSQASTASAPLQNHQIPTEPNAQLEKVKETSKQYWSYFLQHLKKPSIIFNHAEANFINAIISVVILSLLVSLSIYKNMSLVMQPFSGDATFEVESIAPSFIKLFISSTLILSIILLLSISIIYILSKFFGPEVPFKNITSIIGTFTIPFILLNIVAYILLFIDSLVIGNAILSISILLCLFVMPLYVISTLLSKQSKSLDALYAFLIYIVLFPIGLSIIISVFVDSTIGKYLTEFQELLYFL
ncbi:zinc ribbon domain-containing protein [Paenisporosarcina sp. TG20]|uniref:zinc ribbon domain-containing protein n=1 Tax=Paenisporosarcina sp. TG20 TaxID=1211706 RepID=UPI0002FCE50F|nr:zinc ribbon domain-containing protein [Paenisporosarcina sp. TG20]